MKNFKLLILLFSLLLCIFALSSCRCEPSTSEWYLYEITEKLTFSNGAEATLAFNGHVGLTQPWGERGVAERCEIEFSEGGGFKMSLDGEELLGSYTYRHNGFNDTSFTVTLNSGESFSGEAVSYIYGNKLEFEFRGAKYNFSERSDDSYTAEESADDEKWMIKQLREQIEGSEEHNHYSLAPASVTFDGKKYVLNNIHDLSDKEKLVWCAFLDKENVLTNPAPIMEGECYFSHFGDVSVRYDDGEYKSYEIFIIYYIEPIPKEEYPEAKRATLAELYPCLMSDSIDEVKLTVEYTGLAPGFTKEHCYLSGDALIDYLEQLRSIELLEAYPEDVDNSLSQEICTVFSISVTDGDEECVVCIYEGYIQDRGDSDFWWYVRQMPKFFYDGATSSFVTYADEITVVDKQGAEVGVYQNPLSAIEFVICREEHNYTTMTPWLKVVTDFGEIKVYDAKHFWYKGQSYVVVGDLDFSFLFE